MSGLLFVRRESNGNLRYCIPRRHEWAIEHRPSKSKQKDSCETVEKEARKQKPSIGPWRRLKLAADSGHQSSIPRPKKQTHAPFCSMMLEACSLSAKPPKIKLPLMNLCTKSPAVAEKFMTQIKNKARLSVLPVVGLSKDGEWIPPSSGRAEHAKIRKTCRGGWSNRYISFLGNKSKEVKGMVDDKKKRENKLKILGDIVVDDNLRLPKLYSSSHLVDKLHTAEQELKEAQNALTKALIHTSSSRDTSITSPHLAQAKKQAILPGRAEKERPLVKRRLQPERIASKNPKNPLFTCHGHGQNNCPLPVCSNDPRKVKIHPATSWRVDGCKASNKKLPLASSDLLN